jgi:hypothetical protein
MSTEHAANWRHQPTESVGKCRQFARGQGGQIAGLEALVFGLLIFVSATLVVASVWGAIDAKFAASEAAREATRTFVETGADARTADLAAREAAMATLAGHHRSGAADVSGPDGAYRRCGAVEYRVTVRVPIVRVPFIARHISEFHVSATHSELIDPYRSGLSGDAGCP